MKPVGLVDVSPDVSDSPEAARYNRIRRWLGIGDTALGIALLLVLLATGWTGSLRDIALKASYHNSYPLAVFFYVFELALLAKLLSLPLDYYGFRLEHRFNLSNQKLRGWIADEIKGFLSA